MRCALLVLLLAGCESNQPPISNAPAIRVRSAMELEYMSRPRKQLTFHSGRVTARRYDADKRQWTISIETYEWPCHIPYQHDVVVPEATAATVKPGDKINCTWTAMEYSALNYE